MSSVYDKRTLTGRIVYNRPKHRFTFTDVSRIITKVVKEYDLTLLPAEDVVKIAVSWVDLTVFVVKAIYNSKQALAELLFRSILSYAISEISKIDFLPEDVKKFIINQLAKLLKNEPADEPPATNEDVPEEQSDLEEEPEEESPYDIDTSDPILEGLGGIGKVILIIAEVFSLFF